MKPLIDMNSSKKILKKYHAKVPFPITPSKVESAGYDFEQYLKNIISDLCKADDFNDDSVQNILRKVHLQRKSFTNQRDKV